MEESIKTFVYVFSSIVYEAFPFVVLGSVIAGFLEELVPQQFIARVIPRNPYLAIAVSALLGLVFPMCECGIIPVMRRLLRKGLPLSCCVAYILAGPIINPVVMLSTYYAFKYLKPEDMGGFWMVGLRVVFGYIVACITASVAHRAYLKHGYSLLAPLAIPPGVDPATGKMREVESNDDEKGPPEPRPLAKRLDNITETALHDFVDIMVFLIIGAALAGVLKLAMPTVTTLSNPIIAIIFMMLMAVVLCLCSEADAFVAANVAGVPSAAKLAFLVLGPMLDFKLYLMYTRVFRPRLIWTIITTVVIQIFIYMVIVHFVWEGYFVPALRVSTP